MTNGEPDTGRATESATGLVQRSDRDGVAVIELNRPERKNAIIPPMLDELAAHGSTSRSTTPIHRLHG